MEVFSVMLRRPIHHCLRPALHKIRPPGTGLWKIHRESLRMVPYPQAVIKHW